MLYYQS